MTDPLHKDLEAVRDAAEILKMQFEGLQEGYAKKMEWHTIAARTDNVLAGFKGLDDAIAAIEKRLSGNGGG